MAGGDGYDSKGLDETPTWAVAIVCTVIIIISILLEKGLEHLGQRYKEKHKRTLCEALDKVKTELMILGFISLLLTIGQSYIAKICISKKAFDSMLPCSKDIGRVNTTVLLEALLVKSVSNRRLLAYGHSCSQGTVPLVSTKGIHQLHIFIFFLAVFHLVYSAVTMALGMAKVNGWRVWEEETSSLHYKFTYDSTRFRFSDETSFVRRHTGSWTRVPIVFYIGCFFRQFFMAVQKDDYLTLRHGFISVHLAPNSKFDFQKYIKRTLEDDFKVVVGISPILWGFAVCFFLLNVEGWYTIFWVSIFPLIIILAVGTKLQAIITKMALEIQERNSVVRGVPVVHPSDELFWFSRPNLVLFLIHFTLFQNAFKLTYFLWIWYEFGMTSCFHESFALIIVRVVLGVGVQLLCSYVTLPVYALVSQMGSHTKNSIFNEQTSTALKKWCHGAKREHAQWTSIPDQNLGSTPMEHTLRRTRTDPHSRHSARSDQDISDIEADKSSSEPPPS